MSGGWLLAWAGLAIPALLAPGLAGVVIGWMIAGRHVWRIASAPHEERRHIALTAVAVSIGALGLALFSGYALTQEPVLARLALNLGIWGYLLPVFVIVIHRMLPFFSGSVIQGFSGYRPFWALWLILAGSVGHGVLAFAELPQVSWIFDLPAALAAGWLTLRWRIAESFAAPILAVLHVGFAWCGFAFGLFAVHSLLVSGGHAGLGLAPLHALTLGFLTSTLIGMASRVTLGHSGKPITGDATMWRGFWIMQAAALLRIAGEFVHLPGPFDLSFLASLLWVGAFGAWTLKYAPNTWRPRADGQPG
jgi:uncharacterized protein involved in response to NO